MWLPAPRGEREDSVLAALAVPFQVAIPAVAGAAVAGFIVCFMLDKRAGRDALNARERILGEASRDAEQIKRQMELEAEQEIILRREEFETAVRQTRDELRQT